MQTIIEVVVFIATLVAGFGTLGLNMYAICKLADKVEKILKLANREPDKPIQLHEVYSEGGISFYE